MRFTANDKSYDTRINRNGAPRTRESLANIELILKAMDASLAFRMDVLFKRLDEIEQAVSVLENEQQHRR
jgi:hypothetical protein